MTPLQALDQAIKKAGTQDALALKLGIRQSHVSMWRHRKNIPAEYCPAIERATGIKCEHLRPDVDWAVLREQAA